MITRSEPSWSQLPARSRNRPRTRVGAVGALCVLAMPASALVSSQWSLGAGFTVADAVLGAMLLMAVPQLLRGTGPMARLLRLLAPWVWVLFLGSTVSILFAGGPTWAWAQMARNILPPLVFCVVAGAAIARPDARTWMLRAFMISAVLVAASTFLEASPGRSAGVFSNPNYASHYMCAALLLVPFSQVRTTFKVILTAFVLAACVRTGSFSTFVILAAYVLGRMAVPALHGDLRARARLTMVAAVVAVAAVVGLGLGLHQPTDVGSGLDADRFARSSSSRTSLWSAGTDLILAYPVGVAPGGLANRTDLDVTLVAGELHNDVLDMWVQSGPIALIGAVGIVVVVGRRMSHDPRAAGLLAGLVAASLFRQTWNFRHAWLALALGFAFAFASWVHSDARGPNAASDGRDHLTVT